MSTSLSEFPAYKRLPVDWQNADGNYLIRESAPPLLDLYGGHCVNTLGAGDDALLLALNKQWAKCSFTTNLLPESGRERLLQVMAPAMPGGQWQLFCSNSGAEANENLLKLALHATRRQTVVCFEGAFHGRTAAASAVSHSEQPSWPSTPFQVRRIPWGSIAGIDSSVAAVIVEPIQSLAGVRMPPAGFLKALREACDQAGALLLFDEVQTGNGRLGEMWASQYFGVVPDGFSTAKGCAGGFPIGMTFVTQAVAESVPSSICGSTFGGGPLAMAAAAEVQKRLQLPGFMNHVSAIGTQLQKANGLGPIEAVDGVGLLLGLKVRQPTTACQVRDALLQQNILTGLCNDPQILRLSPSLTLNFDDANSFLQAVAQLPSSLPK